MTGRDEAVFAGSPLALRQYLAMMLCACAPWPLITTPSPVTCQATVQNTYLASFSPPARQVHLPYGTVHPAGEGEKPPHWQALVQIRERPTGLATGALRCSYEYECRTESSRAGDDAGRERRARHHSLYVIVMMSQYSQTSSRNIQRRRPSPKRSAQLQQVTGRKRRAEYCPGDLDLLPGHQAVNLDRCAMLLVGVWM